MAFPINELVDCIETFSLDASDAEMTAATAALDANGVTAFIDNYAQGKHSYVVKTLTKLMTDFYDIEVQFNDALPRELLIKRLRNGNDLPNVSRITRAHYNVDHRAEMISLVLDVIAAQMQPLLPQFVPAYRQLATLNSQRVALVVLKVRQQVRLRLLICALICSVDLFCICCAAVLGLPLFVCSRATVACVA
jgi:hypothetical protein